MKVLVVGSGGREHAFAWKIAQEKTLEHVFVAPGNAGTALEEKVSNVDIAADDIAGLLQFAQKHAIDLTVVGPEAPLSLGIVDTFNQANLACFGPTQAAARLESSKAYAKSFMDKYKIPTANYREFNHCETALEYAKGLHYPQVIKADGLAAGKGVIIAQDFSMAKAAIIDMLSHDAFGNAGHKIIIEDFLVGEEASFIVCTDGETIIPMASSQDHKARDEGDLGPNTGGMGAYSPAPCVTAEVTANILEKVIEPTLKGIREEGHNYRGFLYAGIIINPKGEIKVLEYNCRFGDPETQPIMMRLQSSLFELCLASTKQHLSNYTIEWSQDYAIGVVLASQGYPGKYKSNNIVYGLNNTSLPKKCKIFHAGTKQIDGKVLTSGGRVLCITALAAELAQAREMVYSTIENIHWEGGIHFRRDIAWRALK